MNVIGITGTGSLVGQAIIKSIKQSSFKNNKLIGMDYFEDTIGSYWVDKNYLLPDILKEQKLYHTWIATIIDIIKKESIRVLFIGVDFELILFAQYKKLIEETTNCTVMVSSEECIKIADDKYLTYQFLKKNDLFYPKSFTSDEFEEAIKAKEILFPTILKPKKGYRSRDVYIVQNQDELFLKAEKIEEPIVQEMIGNSQTEYTCGVIVIKDITKTIVLRRELKDGNTSAAYYQKDSPEIITQYILDVSKKLDILGVCNFQLRLDDNGIPKIFEINARHSGTTFMRALFGFNEIEFILELLLNNKVIDFDLKEGMVKRYSEEMFIKKNQ
ncbi:MAG: ATP-grasp domain-containing protein [Sulfuricurvum sp.]|jgi:carbamoyl-phosphate synthase large subunit